MLAVTFFACYSFGDMAKKRKNEAASALAKIRWRKMTKLQRSEFMRAAANTRWSAYRKLAANEAVA